MSQHYLTQALALHQAGKLAQAEPLYRAALSADPNNADALHLLGVLLDQSGQAPEAVALIGRAVALRPQAPMFYLNLANALVHAQQPEQAISALRAALRLAPDLAVARTNLAQLLCQQAGRLWQAARLLAALEAAQQAVALNPALPEAQAELGRMLVELGRAAEAEAPLRAVIAARPTSMSARSSLLLSLYYRDDLDPDAIASEHTAQMVDWLAANALPNPPPSPAAPRNGQPLRVGFLSADFRRHSVGWFLRAVLPALDHRQILPFAIASLRTAPDDVTDALRTVCAGWLDIGGQPDDAAAAAIMALKLDVLVDLGGHTAGSRLAVLARVNGPRQISWLGYPGDTGLPSVVARLTDSIADPPIGQPALQYLPPPFLCYAPPPVELPVLPRADGPICFGSFNAFSKISPTTLRLWAGVLAAVPGSSLRIKAPVLADAGVTAHLRQQMAALGIHPARIETLPPQPDLAGHLAAYAGIDIALDTTPYSGTTTTCEALWMGVPVVTLAGQGHHARVSASLLGAVGLNALVAGSAESYIHVAATLAADRARLAGLRAGLRDRLLASPLMNAADFAGRMTAALQAIAGVDSAGLLSAAWAQRAAGARGPATALLKQVMAQTPRHPDALLLLGVLLLDAGSFDQAEAAFTTALAVRPGFVAALGNLALIAGRRADWPRARALLEQALAIAPDDAGLILSWSEALSHCGAGALAWQKLVDLAGKHPADPRPCINLSALALAGDRLPLALQWAEQAQARAPHDPAARAALARVLLRLDRASEAVALAQRSPASPALWMLLAEAHLRVGQPHAAIAVLERAGGQIDLLAADRLRAMALVAQGRAAEAEALFTAVLAKTPNDTVLRSNALYSLQYRDDLDARTLAARLRAGAAAWRSSAPALVRQAGTPLRVGFLSPDFRRHAVASFVLPLLHALDHRQVQPVAFAELGDGDAVTARLRTLCAGWVQTLGRTAAQVAADVVGAGIDVLIDLAGHTAGNRLDVMALRPAAVGVTWLGYPGTTGLDCFDWRISDAVCDPPAEDALSSEPLWRLDPGFHCFAPPAEAPPVGPPPCLETGYVTFGCFNARPKLSQAAIAAMAGVLRAVAGSRLLLKARECDEAAERRQLEALFASHGIAADRLVLLRQDNALADHLARYHSVDIALDSFPYAGTTTTLEALWMGVPVVTLAGNRHAARVGASLLRQMGQPGWIAPSTTTYVEIAAGLAGDKARLAVLRAGQRAQMANSALCRSADFAVRFQSMLAGMTRR